MKKKHIVIAVLIIALAIVGAFLYVSSANTANVGNSTFKLPDKFKVKGNQITTKNANIVKIVSNNTLLKVAELKNNTTMNKAVKSFTKNKENGTVKKTKFDVGNSKIKSQKVVCRTNKTNNKTNNTTNKLIVRYYVTKDNKTYYIESKSNNKSIDAIVREIFLSISKK